jgi:hypothetical protein
MDKLWHYVCTVQVRPLGAQGIYTPVDFPVAMRKSSALPSELFAKWQELLGDEFEPGVMTHVNGCATCGENDRYFGGEEI